MKRDIKEDIKHGDEMDTENPINSIGTMREKPHSRPIYGEKKRKGKSEMGPQARDLMGRNVMAEKKTLLQKPSHWNHDHRKDLCEEHPYGDAGQIIAIILFLIIWALDSFIFKVSTAYANFIPLTIRLVLAALCFLVAFYIAWKSHQVIFEEFRDPPRVIDTGLFSIVRHPLDLSVLLIYLGLFFHNPFSIQSRYLHRHFSFLRFYRAFRRGKTP